MTARRTTLAALLAVAMTLGSAAHAQDAGVYHHSWAVRETVGGDRGGVFEQRVERNEVSLTASGGSWSGSLEYADRVGLRHAAGRSIAQLAEIRLTLTGQDLQPGQTAGGSFEGTARIRTYDVPSPESAFDDARLGATSTDARYRVSGHWGVETAGSVFEGEILYESAFPEHGRMQNARAEAARFNRGSREDGASLGDPQSFTVPADSLPGPDGAEGSPPEGPTFWEYVRAGLAGTKVSQARTTTAFSREAYALLSARPVGATPLADGAVAIGVQAPGAFLDAKNRAAGLLDDEGPTSVDISVTETWEENRLISVEPVAPADSDPLAFYGERILDAVENRDEAGLQDAIGGADSLAADVRATIDGRGGGISDPRLMKLWSHAARAVVYGPGVDEVIGGTRDAAMTVANAHVPSTGPMADAVLVWLDSQAAPLRARSLSEFASEPSADASAAAGENGLVERVLARYATPDEPPSLPYGSDARLFKVAPSSWPAWLSPDGRFFWSAGKAGQVALTDGALRGWAFSIERAWLVEADRVGSIVHTYDLE